MITPLASRPIPPNGNIARSMFVWVGTSATADPLDTDADQQELINFCGTNGINILYLDIWNYLGGANWTAAKVSRMRGFVECAHYSGIKVFAMFGSPGFGTMHQWVMKNIVQPVTAYNTMVDPLERFDGWMLDVEYWTNPTAYPPATHLPGLCDLVYAIKDYSQLPVGVFGAFYLHDTSRPEIDYRGQYALDGAHLTNTADFVVVGSYRDHALDASDGPGQVALFAPWYDYARQPGRNDQLFCGSETGPATPAYVTYQGATRAAMEAEHTIISNTYKVATNAAFCGQAISSYKDYKVMP